MPDGTTTTDVLEALLAGASVEELEAQLDTLAAEERQTVLCTACYVLDEVRANCVERADEIAEFLQRNCRYFIAGQKTCIRCSGEFATA